ncbi:heme-binding protein 1-like [Argopecten irradians]|uniref:heme-binding protein 1-like n=1 Tax=Argopecten irradians TaxID=31199 RepID=UPI0037169E7C
MDRTWIVLSVFVTMLMVTESYSSAIPRVGSSCTANAICPSYTVINVKSTNNYEYRRLDQSKWIATNNMNGTITAETERDMRRRLEGYFTGENDAGVTLDRTLPVVLRVAQDFLVMLQMIPPLFHDNAPSPTDSSVYIQEVPPFYVFVRRFVGCSLHTKCPRDVVGLRNDIGNPSRYYQEYFLLAEFESSTPNDLTYEAWLVSTEQAL